MARSLPALLAFLPPPESAVGALEECQGTLFGLGAFLGGRLGTVTTATACRLLGQVPGLALGLGPQAAALVFDTLGSGLGRVLPAPTRPQSARRR
jgi:hypothetical protein